MFYIYLRTNSDLCHLQHKLIGFYNRDEKCLLHGMNWAFKYSSLRFVIKGLMRPEQPIEEPGTPVLNTQGEKGAGGLQTLRGQQHLHVPVSRHEAIQKNRANL